MIVLGFNHAFPDGVNAAQDMQVTADLGCGAGLALVVSLIPCQVQHGKALA